MHDYALIKLDMTEYDGKYTRICKRNPDMPEF